MDSTAFLDPQADVKQTSNRLPHWEQEGCTYFLTFRLADSLPASLLADWREESDQWMKFLGNLHKKRNITNESQGRKSAGWMPCMDRESRSLE